MELATYRFRRASTIDAFRNADGSVRTYSHENHPDVLHRLRDPKGRRLHEFGRGPFIFVELDPLPSAPGAYVIVGDETILYVGRSKNLDRRWDHLGYGVISVLDCYTGPGGQKTNCRINSLIATELIAGNELELWVHETVRPDAVEVAVYNACKPPWNVGVPALEPDL